MLDILEDSDHFPGILCLAVVGGRCKQSGIKMHGYHLASGIEGLMMAIKVLNNRDYYDAKYTIESTSNMIIDVTNWFYDCLTENINTMRLSNEDKVDIKKLTSILTKCMNYSVRRISKIIEIKDYQSLERMKRTDIFCLDFDKDTVDNYRQMKRLDQPTMIEKVNGTYGMICRLAMCLGWMITMGDETDVPKLEKLADDIALIIKVYDDFKNLKRDMRYGNICSNFVVTHGIKEALILFDHSSISYAEKTEEYGIETRTCNEIVKVITDFIDKETQEISVDLDTEFDDISCISAISAISAISTMSIASGGSISRRIATKSTSTKSSSKKIDSKRNVIESVVSNSSKKANKTDAARAKEEKKINKNTDKGITKNVNKNGSKGGNKNVNKHGSKGGSKGGSKSGSKTRRPMSEPNSGHKVIIIS